MVDATPGCPLCRNRNRGFCIDRIGQLLRSTTVVIDPTTGVRRIAALAAEWISDLCRRTWNAFGHCSNSRAEPMHFRSVARKSRDTGYGSPDTVRGLGDLSSEEDGSGSHLMGYVR